MKVWGTPPRRAHRNTKTLHFKKRLCPIGVRGTCSKWLKKIIENISHDKERRNPVGALNKFNI
jgi:hypothetical protein